MKILVLNYEFPPIGGGGSPVSYEISKRYVRLGHEVDVVTMNYRGMPFCEVIDGIKIYRVKCWRSKKEVCHPWEQMTYLISAKRFLKKLLKEKSYDINHTHFIIPTGVLAAWLYEKYKLPYIITSHGSDVLGYNKRFAFLYPLLKKPWIKIAANAKCITAPSDFLKNKIEDITTKGRVETITNGLDLSEFIPMKKENRILVVARLFKNKGVRDILEALSKIDLKDWTVDIVGHGPVFDELKEFCSSSNLKDRVRFAGWIDHKDKKIKEFYGRARIFISASYFESFGQVVLEAISSGCYPILSDIEAHRSIVKEDEYFFKIGNADQLRNKIKDTIEKMPLKFNINIDRFQWDNVIKDYERILLS